MHDSLRVTVVIVTFNSASVIEECLRCLPADVIVSLVDNASVDDTIALAKAVRPDVKVICNKDNKGFGSAVNIAARRAETDYVLLLNPDARLSPDTVETLVAKADKYQNAAIVAPVLYHPDGEQQTSYRLDVFRREVDPGMYVEPDGDMCVEFFSGAVMLWRMSDIQDIGLFDENFFFTYEDDDLCMRVRAAGKTLLLTTDTSVVHDPGTSTVPTAALVLKKTRYVMSARLYIEEKYHGRVAAKRMALKEAAKYFLRTLTYLPVLYKKGIIRSYGRFRAATDFLVSPAKH